MKQSILKFSPLLLIYIILILMYSSNILEGDEGGYVSYATWMANLISPQSNIHINTPTLWWGPGYPLILSFFALLKLPWLWAKLLNAFFLFGALIYFYKTLRFYIKDKYATFFSLVLGFYPPLFREINLLMTENLVFLLICGYLYHTSRLHKLSEKAWGDLLIASFYLGYLALTKIFFGYVILTGLLTFLILFLWRRTDNFKKTMAIYLIALIFCVPYLVFTYSQTGKIFYWGTSGGLSLYWMSSPYDHELGSWFSSDDVREMPELSPHRDFFEQVIRLSLVEQDEVLKKRAIENIINHPDRYLMNWLANVGRLFFSYPFSVTSQKMSTYFYIIPNMFLMVLWALSLFPSLLRWRSIPYEIYSWLFFLLISLGGTSLLSAFERQFRPFAPIILLWIAFVYLQILKIELRSDSEILMHQVDGR